MDLILWRHAQAEPESELVPDLERALTSKGERQAQRMARWLNHRLAQSTRILVSPALRCQQTAKALERGFRTLPMLAPEAPAADLLQAARWPDCAESVLVIGHQPALGQLAARLLSGADQTWPIKKGAVWWLRHRVQEGLLETSLIAVQSVDML